LYCCVMVRLVYNDWTFFTLSTMSRAKSRIALSIRQLEDDPLLETLDKVIPMVSCCICTVLVYMTLLSERQAHMTTFFL
jgi:hypothetical protein